MSDVEFDDNKNSGTILYTSFKKTNEAPAVIRWLIDRKIFRSNKQAEYFLISLILICVVLSIYFFHSTIAKRVIHVYDPVTKTFR